MSKLKISVVLLFCLFACKPRNKQKNSKFTVVTTTTMITDLLQNIGGEAIEVKGIMGPGVDPHLYKASEGDVAKLTQADFEAATTSFF